MEVPAGQVPLGVARANLEAARRVLQLAFHRRGIKIEELHDQFGPRFQFGRGWGSMSVDMWDASDPAAGFGVLAPWDGTTWRFNHQKPPPKDANCVKRGLSSGPARNQLFALVAQPGGPIAEALPNGGILLRGTRTRSQESDVTIMPAPDAPGGWKCERGTCMKTLRARQNKGRLLPWCLHVDIGRIATGITWIAELRNPLFDAATRPTSPDGSVPSLPPPPADEPASPQPAVRENALPPSIPAHQQAPSPAVPAEEMAAGNREPPTTALRVKPPRAQVVAPVVFIGTETPVRGFVRAPDGTVSVAQCSETFAGTLLNMLPGASSTPASKKTAGKFKLTRQTLAAAFVQAAPNVFRRNDDILRKTVPGWEGLPAKAKEKHRRKMSHILPTNAFRVEIRKHHGWRDWEAQSDPENGQRSMYRVVP